MSIHNASIPPAIFRQLKRVPQSRRRAIYEALQRTLVDDEFFRTYARKGRGKLFSVALPHGYRVIVYVGKNGERELLRLVA